MSFNDLSSKTPLPANDNAKAKAAPATATPGKTPPGKSTPGETPGKATGKSAAEGAPAPRGS